ncbi:L-threonylcarbamoyladenylate synthase [Streptomyces sp. H27-S2]|uniref:L-threonylcarbamoyladenylate synthase n=1 Tax=Streptomyces antarcticus TaxID=2996458 RepID=UPI002270E594|nr:L-threonylcarbamoyladenylate synthase [Streptomyces sp. H27-S2]MCY0949092.1 L-threonylcarbamoyladenylate synthase [Streptomyces sp. H27-S2]
MSQRYDCCFASERAVGLGEAAAALRRGELVVLPTDTVYGVGADAFSPAAVCRLLDAKGRGRNMPSPVLVGGPDDLDGLVENLPEQAHRLVDALWPGGLTLVAHHKPSLEWDLGETGGTVALRMPAHPVALDLLNQTGPLAVSSANLTGQPSPQDCDAAHRMLGDTAAVYLDGGPTPADVPSSIVDITATSPVLLRARAISADELRKVAPGLQQR